MTATEILGTPVNEGRVLPEWIDSNQHMNVAYYVLAFDHGIDALWESFGITDDYINETQGSTFAVECHLTYVNELHEGDRYLITSQVLGYDEKRIHQFQRIYHADKGYLAATAEWMNLHVNLGTRRVSPWPEPILAAIGEFATRQARQERPTQAGRQMSLKAPLYCL